MIKLIDLIKEGEEGYKDKALDKKAIFLQR
jgi:hypothetical protein